MPADSKRAYLAIAHRGASDYEPENTLRAFRRAIALGADMSELDVHMSKDGHIMVIHNDAVHIDGERKAIADLTLAELRTVDVGRGERIPTLQEVITAVKGKGGLYIELKGATTPQPVADLLRANGFTDRKQVIVGSFLLPLVREIKTYAPELVTSILVGPVLSAADLIAAAQSVGASYVHLCWGARSPQPHTLLTPSLLADLHAAGLGVVLWNEERLSELAVLRTLPVEGICSNAPDLL
jgi:glycerophosphoryl diester phosphodiesterase